MHLTLADFLDKATAWQGVRRPNGVGALNAWADIAARLRERGVDVGKVDGELYSQLSTATDAQELERKIDEVASWSVDGTLDQRYHDFSAGKHTTTTSATTTSTTPSSASAPHHHVPTTPTPTPTTSNATGLYSKRFTHAYPLGRPRSMVSDVEKAERRAELDATNTFLAQQQQQQKPGEEQGQGVCGWWGRSKKKRNRIFFIAFMAAIFGGVLGVMLWAMGTSRWDFTAKAETG